MIRFYDRQGEPLELTDWARLTASSTERVAYTTIGDTRVSTVWLGVDHQFGDGPPLIFETMVFGGPLAEEQERYSTEAQALAGHESMVARVREAQAP